MYIILAPNNVYWECDTLTHVLKKVNEIDECLFDKSLIRVFKTDELDLVTLPKFIAHYNATRGELTIHDLSGKQVFSDNQGGIIASIEHSRNPEDDIYDLVREYYSDVLMDFDLF